MFFVTLAESFLIVLMLVKVVVDGLSDLVSELAARQTLNAKVPKRKIKTFKDDSIL